MFEFVYLIIKVERILWKLFKILGRAYKTEE